jgi:hypothetical protein
VLAAACGGKGTPPPTVDAGLEGFQGVELDCPGDPSCPSAGDGVLEVGAARAAYTPANFETYTDENGDREWQHDEPFNDLNGNGKFDGVWLFGGSRAALSVKTDVDARALAFIQGDTTAVVLYIDSVGLISGDLDLIRQHPILAGVDVDHIIIGSTHAHDTPDTLGLWGPSPTATGRQQFVLDALYAAGAQAVKAAIESARPATMQIASTKLLNDPANPSSLTDDFNKDIRDPIIFDPTLTIARFVEVGTNTTIGTLVNWANHPEASHFSDTDSSTITAHYIHWLREGIENGVLMTESSYAPTDLPGLGGITVFAQGALGGQIGSLRGTHPKLPDGTPTTTLDHTFEQSLGTNAAALALRALADTGESVSELPLALKTATYNARIDNTYFHVAFLIELLGPHPLIGYNPDDPIEEGNLPWMPLRSSFLQVGPLGLVTAPGELHPELWVGGYDGSWSHGYPMLMDPNKPNLPNFELAPAPPYMRDLVLGHTGVKYPVLAGCAEDYIGYIVPSYNYALDPQDPYLVEAEGDHYEEVYSLGPQVEQHAVHPILQLLQYRR